MSNKCCLSIPNREHAYARFKESVLERIDFVQLDLLDIAQLYPTLNYVQAYKYNDVLVLNFLNEILSECNRIKVLFLNHQIHGLQILSQMHKSFSSLRSIMCLNCNELLDPGVLSYSKSETGDPELRVVLQNQPTEFTEELLQFLQASDRRYSLHFLAHDLNKPMVEFSLFTQGNVRKGPLTT